MNTSQIPNLDLFYSHLPAKGFFVEVGAYDGITHSNTYPLAAHGWRGIYIEPIKEYFDKCREIHQRHDVEVHQLLISDFDGVSRIHKAGEASTACEDTVAFLKKQDFAWSQGIHQNTIEEVPCKTLTHFLNDIKAPRKIDLLVIDTESYEWKVLSGLDLDAFDVKMLIVELHEKPTIWHELEVQRENIRNVNEHLARKGYEKIFSDDINSIFLKPSPVASSYIASPKPPIEKIKLASPLGHYHSPIPNLEEVQADEEIIWGPLPRTLAGINLDETGQLALFHEFAQYYRDMPFKENPKPGLRSHLDNPWFAFGDAIVLHCMMRHQRPKRIIEIGSGFSSAVILDTNDLFLDGGVTCTFIEPHPQRLLSLFTDRDRRQHALLASPLQKVDLQIFRQLQAGDMLFVDSSHVSKIHSDVNRIFFDILPLLADNVMIHFHDIFYPFEYPREWVMDVGVAWNESYLLRAFLQYNDRFKIQFFNSFFGAFYRDLVREHMPLCFKKVSSTVDPDIGESMGASIWLKKV